MLQNAALIWVPLTLAAALAAWFFMDNLTTARSTVKDQLAVARRGQTWVMSLLYVGTFGSFIGYSAGLPLLVKTQFPEVAVAQVAFLGPLVGSLTRPLGGWLADRIGGARVTFWTFAAMSGGVVGVLVALDRHSFPAFLASFLLLFVLTGVGNGSTFRMIPVIFRQQALRAAPAGNDVARDAALAKGRRDAAAVLGFTSAIGAYGGFLIPKSYGTAIAQTGSVTAAFVTFLTFYAACLVVTWWCYLRRPVGARALATARV